MPNITVSLTDAEVKKVKDRSKAMCISVSQFVKDHIFPDQLNNLDSHIFKALRAKTPLSKTITFQTDLIERTHVVIEKRDYVYLSRYNYVFIRDTDQLHPLRSGLFERDAEHDNTMHGMKSIYHTYLSTLTKKDVVKHEILQQLSEFCKVVKDIETYEKINWLIDEKFLLIQKDIHDTFSFFEKLC